MADVTKLHRVVIEFEPECSPTLKLIHPEGGCERATQCGECGMGVGDPEFPGCECCPREDDECWLIGWVEQYAGGEVLAGGPVEFAVVPECDGESLILHVAAEPDEEKAEARA